MMLRTIYAEFFCYRITVENIEVMKETVQSMERKVENYERLQDKVARLEVENEVGL